VIDEDSTAVLLFAHGSSLEESNHAVHELAHQVEELGPCCYVRAAFLQLAHPTLEEAVAEAVAAGRRRVIVIPYFLTVGVHLQRDLPNLIAPLAQKYSALSIEVGQALEGHPLMASIILGRVEEVIQATKGAW
jgi:sirohydrochlorin ferrochelatase